jgi:beta-N-acetylhexosaminidase
LADDTASCSSRLGAGALTLLALALLALSGCGALAPARAAETPRPDWTPRPLGAASNPYWPRVEAAAAPAPSDRPAPTLGTTERTTTPAPLGSQAVPTSPVVEDALRQLTTLEDRVGQLLLLGWVGATAEAALPTLRELRPGGIVYVDNTRQAAAAAAINADLAARAREIGLLPLFMAVDHEGGRVQRIDDVANLGSNRAFAAGGADERAACERGQTHAEQLRRLGFNMNLAPVLDVNNNPANPVIGDRSYGADPTLVARLGSAYVRGLQGGGVVAVGKHFPGHGNTGVDSHLELPYQGESLAQLEQVELIPFRRALEPDTRLAAIMSAHIVFPAVDPSGAPATLSRPIMTDLLRDRLDFTGLAVSDDMAGMRAITDNFSPGEAAVRAVRAGVDLLIIAGGLPRQLAARDALLAAERAGELSRERLDEAVRRVVEVKARFGLLGGAPPTLQPCS